MQKQFEHLKLIGGAPCLDFANTIDWRTGERPKDFLHGYGDFILWCQHAGVLEESQAQRLLKRAASNPNEARAAFTQAIDLRETIYRLFATAISDPLPERDLAVLNVVLGDAMAHRRLLLTKESVAWTWHDVEGHLEWPSWPIARSAADLLTSEKRGRVRECAGPGCGWLFLDMSRNRSRRWCDMADCGNREKARRNYARKRVVRITSVNKRD